TKNPKSAAGPSNLVYIIYTSATTGNPKGVMIENKNVVNIAHSWRRQYALDTFEVNLLQLASISFDVFSGDLCRALLNGGKLIICPTESKADIEELSRFILNQQ